MMFKIVGDNAVIKKSIIEWRKKLGANGDQIALTSERLWGMVPDTAKIEKEEPRPSAFDISLRIQNSTTKNTVLIRIPEEGIDENVLGCVAMDSAGHLWILRQGSLHGVRGANFAEFPQLTNMMQVEVSPVPRNTDRKYYAVACLDEDDGLVRRRTAAFVHECQRIRRTLEDVSTDQDQRQARLEEIIRQTDGRPETTVTVQRRSAEASEIIRKQTAVWQALKRFLGERMTNPILERLETDLVIDRPGDTPLLVEIKTDSNATSVQQGLGQLLIYGDLYSPTDGSGVVRVLLVPKQPRQALATTCIRLGIQIHTYNDPDAINFHPAFRTLAGIPQEPG